MTATHIFFVSPFDQIQEGIKSESQQWKPAFPDQIELQQNEYIKQDLQKNNKKIKQQKRQIDEFQDISLSVGDDIQLQDLENIDISIPSFITPLIKKKQISIKYNYQQSLNKYTVDNSQKYLQTSKQQGNEFDEQWLRRLDKIIAARAFVYRGYGVNYLKQQLRSGTYDGFCLDQSKYKSISGSMVRQAFRKLQSFLLRDCKRKLHSLSGYQMKLLQTLLLNCRSTLNTNSSNHFIQIVKIHFILQDIRISENDCARLYQAIYRGLQRKIGILRGTSVRSDSYSDQNSRYRTTGRSNYQNQGRYRTIESDIISAETENEIIKEYLVETSMSKLRDNLRSKRIINEYITAVGIRNVLRRVLRGTIRFIQNQLNEGIKDYRQLNKMTDDQIKWIIEASEGLQGRRQLCRIHLQQRNDRKFLQQVYRELLYLMQRRQTYNYSYYRKDYL